MAVPRSFTRAQRAVILGGMLGFVLTVVVLQLWLLTATTNAYLGGDDSLIVPAAIASVLGLAMNVGLLRYAMRLERRPSGSA